jgi:hypothetical protein
MRYTTTTSDLTSFLTVPSIVYLLTVLLAVHMLHIGIWAFTSTLEMSTSFGIPTNASNPWVYIFAARELSYGIAIFRLAYLQYWRAMGVFLGTVVICGITDAVVGVKFGEGC